jgi:hypothetical protein
VSPTGGKVSVSYFFYTGEGHLLIIRFGLHRYWIRKALSSMQGASDRRR